MTDQINTLDLQLSSPEEALALYGIADANLRLMRELVSVALHARGETLQLKGTPEDVQSARILIEEALAVVRRGEELTGDHLRRAARSAAGGQKLSEATKTGFSLPRRLRAKTAGQAEYLQKIHEHDITFGLGPAGTGKTYLAVAMGVQALKNKTVKRIVLTRPAVEAGERLGFLPGDLQAKIDPYLRPLHDALHDMIDPEKFESYLQSGVIEVAPLAFMRGRTLNDSFVILDEAQNTTPEQMKMFLTRMGFSSKLVVTGDVTQIDLPRHTTSGLRVAKKVLGSVEGIAWHQFAEEDVVRHPLVARIVRAYQEAEDDSEVALRG